MFKGLEAVLEATRDGKWRTLAEISALTKLGETSVSARLRDLRKSEYGGRTVERRASRGAERVFEYRVANP
jgi:hypothetical protein